MNVSLTPELEKFVESKVRSGRYTSVSEVVREALRLLELYDLARAKEVTEISGLEPISGKDIPSSHAKVLLSRTTVQYPQELISAGNKLRAAALEWIRGLQKGRVFSNEEMYAYLQKSYGTECNIRGRAEREPRFRNDARWAVQDAKRAQLAQDTGRPGQHQRI
jgi:putative addiction module CopG family antidote